MLKTIGWTTAIVGGLLLISKVSGNAASPMVPDEPETPVKSKIQPTDRTLKIQQYLNKILTLTPLTADGITGPKTIARIQEFQRTLTKKGKTTPDTGTWGNATEANALAVYGYTPFQGKSISTVKTDPVKPVNYDQAQAEGKLQALLVKKYAWGIGVKVNFRDKASVTGKILSSIQPNGMSALGMITEVSFETGASGTRRMFYKLGNRGWIQSTDVSVYASKDFKKDKLAGIDGGIINGL